ARKFRPADGRKSRRNARGRAAARGRCAGGTLQPDAGELRAHICRRLRGRLLQLQMGGGPGGRRVRSVRRGRGVRRHHRDAFSRFDSQQRRQLGRDGSLRAVSRPRARCSPAAQANWNRGVKRWIALLAVLGALAAGTVAAAAAYVSDELVLGVFAEQNGQGQRLATLHSGASVETLGVNGDFTQVRLNDGITGWVKSAYLTTHEPAIVRIKQLQDELDRSRATTPALAEAAARSEVEQLKRELTAKQSELMAANAALAPPAGPGVADAGVVTRTTAS